MGRKVTLFIDGRDVTMSSYTNSLKAYDRFKHEVEALGQDAPGYTTIMRHLQAKGKYHKVVAGRVITLKRLIID